MSGTTHPTTQRRIPKYSHLHHHTDLMSRHRQHLQAIKYLQHKNPEIWHRNWMKPGRKEKVHLRKIWFMENVNISLRTTYFIDYSILWQCDLTVLQLLTPKPIISPNFEAVRSTFNTHNGRSHLTQPSCIKQWVSRAFCTTLYSSATHTLGSSSHLLSLQVAAFRCIFLTKILHKFYCLLYPRYRIFSNQFRTLFTVSEG